MSPHPAHGIKMDFKDGVTHTFLVDWDSQQQAVIDESPSSRIAVEAGPGTGKTAVACARVARLIDNGLDPANIWLVSFTRTAVKEIRDRIAQMVNEEASAAAVRITTVDSQVWYLRQGFDYAESSELFGSYEANILSIVEMLRAGHEGLLEYIGTMQHFIVDEAQDLVGNRSQLILELIRRLPEHCGVTVFADSAQAIYGFSEDEMYKCEPVKKSLLDDAGLGFREMQLTVVHRSDSNSLKTIFSDVRDFVLDTSVFGKDKHDIVLDGIMECADGLLSDIPLKRLKEKDDVLVLFRRQKEVFLYSSYLSKNGIAHRVRMGNMPPMLPQWPGIILGNQNANQLDRHRFHQLWSKRIGERCSAESFDEERAWTTIFSLCGNRRGKVDIDQLKNLLSRRQPPVELSVYDAGKGGPILSTIHASKGREANIVFLANSRTYFNNSEQTEEETRVLFVSATRARKELYLFEGPDDSSCTLSKREKRIIKVDKHRGGRYRVSLEFRPDDDLDYQSFIETGNNRKGLIRSVHVQMILRQHLKLSGKVYFIRTGFSNYDPYDFFLAPEGHQPVRVGQCTQDFNDTLLRTIKEVLSYVEEIRLPRRILGRYFGGRTAVTDKQFNANPENPIARSGFFILPTVLLLVEFDLRVESISAAGEFQEETEEDPSLRGAPRDLEHFLQGLDQYE